MINFIQLSTAFVDGSNQQEKIQVIPFDRFNSEPFKLSENHMMISVLEQPPIPLTIGRIKAEKLYFSDRTDKLSLESEPLDLSECPPEEKEKSREYWIPRSSEEMQNSSI